MDIISALNFHEYLGDDFRAWVIDRNISLTKHAWCIAQELESCEKSRAVKLV